MTAEFALYFMGLAALQIILQYGIDHQQRRNFLQTVYVVRIRREFHQRQLQQHAAQAQASVALYRKLVQTTAHDLQTPISALQSGWSILKKKHEEKDPTMKHVLDIMHAALTFGLNFVATMGISTSYLDGRTVTIVSEPIALRDLLEDCAKCARLSCSSKDIVTVFDDRIEEVSKHIRSDRHIISRNLLNLINNAASYGHGPIEIVIKLVEDSVEFIVSDTGPGVPEEFRESIWQPFTSLNSNGCGLGLFVVQQQSQSLDGECGLRSNDNSGSSFWFRIPHHPVASLAKNSPKNLPSGTADYYAEVVRAMSPSVLLVDDTITVLELHSLELQSYNIRVDTACGPEEGLAKMEIEYYDLVLCDYKMPQKNGAEVTAEFRIWEEIHRERVQVIWGLTAYPNETSDGSGGVGVKAECLAAGMQDLITKPLNIPTILKLLVDIDQGKANQGLTRKELDTEISEK